MPISITIKSSAGAPFSVEIEETATVAELKQKLVQLSNIPVEQQRLIYSGHVLKDALSLASYAVKDGHTVHLVRGASNNTAAQSSTASPSPSNIPNPLPATSTPNTTPLPSPFGGFGLGGFGAPNMQQMQQQLMQNPAMMRDVMNSPMMQNLLQNPELMRSMLMSNPQMREVVERNPEIGHILNDPQILRQTLEMARNPELMREMMRNTDRAMSNIESHPEGFNHLRRMYTNFQEPLMNATSTPQANNPFSALFGNNPTGSNNQQQQQNTATPAENPNTAPLPNPWGPLSSATPSTTNFSPFTSPFTPPTSSTPTGDPTGALNADPLAGIDPSLVASMLQNPAFQSTFQQVFSNPEMVQQAISTNPMLSNMINQNPMVAQMFSNPDFLRQMGDPNTFTALLQLQSAMQRLQGTPLMNMFGGGLGQQLPTGDLFSGLGNVAPPSNPQQPPEERYKTQLEQLQEMGFRNQEANIRALEATGGNVQLAIERLLSFL